MAIEPETQKAETDAIRHASGQSRSLAASLPRLIMEARRIAATMIHGLHGRRRSGSGENFWQYRRFLSGEPARRVDWRRSARDDNLYVREQEWEAAHTVWIWPDRSPSMVFSSPMVSETKRDRALVVAFALAEILVEGGERVGIPGLMRPSASRNVIDKMAQAMIHDPTERTSLPPSFSPSPLSEVVLLSDFWSPISEFRSTLAQVSGARAHSHVVQIVDPAEETFPYSGRIEFLEPEGLGSVTAGRAETWRDDYIQKLASHRAAMRDEADKQFASSHHSSHRPSGQRACAGAACAHGPKRRRRVCTDDAAAESGGERMIGGLPLGFAQPLVLLGLLSLPVLWWLLRLIPPRPRRIEFPAGPAAVRYRAQGRNARAHALVADAAAAFASGITDLRRRRTDVESFGRHLRRIGTARIADRRWLGRGLDLGHPHPHWRRHPFARRSRWTRGRDHPDIGSRPRHLHAAGRRRPGCAAKDRRQSPMRSSAPMHCRR